MVTRETTVHVVCVVAGFVALGVLTAADVTATFAGQVLALGLFYGLTFGGAHFYYALKGEDGIVPVTGRWRFVGLVAVTIALVVVAVGAGETEFGGYQVRSLVGWAFVPVLVAYFVAEGLAGYRQSIQGP